MAHEASAPLRSPRSGWHPQRADEHRSVAPNRCCYCRPNDPTWSASQASELGGHDIESIKPSPARSLVSGIPAAHAALAVASIAAAGIHFAVMGEHFDEYFLFGLFFSVVAWLQALWALAVVVAPTRQLLIGGWVGNAVVVAVWVVSRTVGLPLGPEAGTAETAAFLDVLSTVLEVAIVAGIAALLISPRLARSGRSGALAVAGLTILLVVLTTAGVATGGHDSGHHEEDAAEHAATDKSGFVRVDLGAGRLLQVLVDEGATLMHLTFFSDEGTALDGISSLAVNAVSHDGEEVDIPVKEFETGHYVAPLDLQPGEWDFEVTGAAAEGGDFAASFGAHLD